MRSKVITLIICSSLMTFACQETATTEQGEMAGEMPSLAPPGGATPVGGVESGEMIGRTGLPVGSTCDDPYQCATLICFADLDAESGVCAQPCVDEPEVCGAEGECRAYAAYGSICVPREDREVDAAVITDAGPPPDQWSPEELDMNPIAVDMSPGVACQAREVYFTNTGGVEVGRITLTEPNQSQEVALSSLSGRTNRARVTYDAQCDQVTVDLLERHPHLCFDFSRDICDRLPDSNCGAGIIVYIDGQSTILSENSQCGPSPEEQGWTQYHTQIESCYPVYNGPPVDRFEVGRYTFPLCDNSVRGQHWCISVVDGSPSRCLGCEVHLYTCR